MPSELALEVGRRIAYRRRMARMTQVQLATAANIGLGTLCKIERGARGAGDGVLDAIAGALGVDPSALLPDHGRSDNRVHQAMPALSAVIATYDMPDDGPVRPLQELSATTGKAVQWRLGAQYVHITRHLPELLAELSRAFHAAPAETRSEVASLLVAAYRTADAVAYKYRAHDLSARLIDLMRWAAEFAEDPLLNAHTAYVRTEVHFAARAHGAGLRALQAAIDAAPPPSRPQAIAARGALHMRAAVIAGRAGDVAAATEHLDEALAHADRVPEAIYCGTAFGPDSARIHEVSVAVSLGGEHLQRALDVASSWSPPRDMGQERRSGFYIELARAELWSAKPDAAFKSLQRARRIAPQHAREHLWVRDDVATIRRIKRAERDELDAFCDWCHARG